MAADPVVSPADTPPEDLARYIRAALSFTDADSERHGLAALDALLAVGERDKAERDRQQKRAERAEQVLREQVADNREVVVAGERDRQQIARLTEALERLLDCKGGGKGLVSVVGGEPAACEQCADAARAVLADEEDARPAKCVGCGRETPELAQVSDPFIDRRYGVCRECLSNLHVTPVVLRAAGEGDTAP